MEADDDEGGIILPERMELTVPFDYQAIERILPHRYPFLLVDRITEFEVDTRVVGVKNVTGDESYLSRVHGQPPVLPPTILTEAVAQVGAILILAKPENREKLIYFMGIERVRYRRPVHPGDTVIIEATRAAPAQPDGCAQGRRPRRRPGGRRGHDDVRARPAQRSAGTGHVAAGRCPARCATVLPAAVRPPGTAPLPVYCRFAFLATMLVVTCVTAFSVASPRIVSRKSDEPIATSPPPPAPPPPAPPSSRPLRDDSA